MDANEVAQVEQVEQTEHQEFMEKYSETEGTEEIRINGDFKTFFKATRILSEVPFTVKDGTLKVFGVSEDKIMAVSFKMPVTATGDIEKIGFSGSHVQRLSKFTIHGIRIKDGKAYITGYHKGNSIHFRVPLIQPALYEDIEKLLSNETWEFEYGDIDVQKLYKMLSAVKGDSIAFVESRGLWAVIMSVEDATAIRIIDPDVTSEDRGFIACYDYKLLMRALSNLAKTVKGQVSATALYFMGINKPIRLGADINNAQVDYMIAPRIVEEGEEEAYIDIVKAFI